MKAIAANYRKSRSNGAEKKVGKLSSKSKREIEHDKGAVAKNADIETVVEQLSDVEPDSD